MCVAVSLAVALPASGSIPHPQIVGGSEVVPPGRHPFAVAMVATGTSSLHCGGSVIDPSWVMTAAHCVQDPWNDPTIWQVLIGRHRLSANDGERHALSEILIHPQFVPGTDSTPPEYDLALLHLSSPTSYGGVALAGAADYQPGTPATVMGWGTTTFNGSPSDELREVVVPVVSDDDCAAAYPGDFAAALMICAGDLENGGVDSCQGDSGGPLVVFTGSGAPLEVGIVSWGTECALPGKPGAYAEVAALRAWVLQQTGNLAPNANNDAAATAANQPVIITVTANDSDTEDGTVVASSATVVSGPIHGGLTAEGAGMFTYAPDSGYSGSDSFTYAVEDSSGAISNPGTVTISISPPPTTTTTTSTTTSVPSPPTTTTVPPPPPSPPPPLQGFGLVDNSSGRWSLRNSAGSISSFFFGDPADVPFLGDWDCDGIETPGLYRRSDGFAYLRNSNTQGNADISFFFGNPGDVPVAGDFDGDGCDTVSIYRPAEGRFYIIDRLGRSGSGLGAADVAYYFGDPGDEPFVGDFDGDGVETVGLHRKSTGLVYFRNSNSQGIADAQFTFGDPGDRFISGDWTGDGRSSAGLYRPGRASFYFRFTNSSGFADAEVPFGAGTELPVAGDF